MNPLNTPLDPLLNKVHVFHVKKFKTANLPHVAKLMLLCKTKKYNHFC